jgi:hypothetical protein
MTESRCLPVKGRLALSGPIGQASERCPKPAGIAAPEVTSGFYPDFNCLNQRVEVLLDIVSGSWTRAILKSAFFYFLFHNLRVIYGTFLWWTLTKGLLHTLYKGFTGQSKCIHPPSMSSLADPQSAAVAMVVAADLGCALCRKRTSETVTRLCHACGLPVHLSCAQHVAARECELEFGFPVPSIYCSKRCYDSADILAAAHGEDLSGEAGGGKRLSPQVPNEVTAALTLKIGDVSRTSRKHLSITTFRFLLSEGFSVFRAKVNSRAAKELQAYTLETFVREDQAIYIRPGVHSKQAELVELNDANFEARIRKTFRNFLKRKATQSASGGSRQEQFECDIYAYVKREAVVRRRKTNSAAAAAGADAASGGRSGGGVRMLSGLAAQHQLMVQQQQQHMQQSLHGRETNDGASAGGTVAVGAKRRLSEIQDRAEVGTVDGDSTPRGYKSVRMVLNGSVVAVQVNVGDLMSALGLSTTAPSDHDNDSADGDC